MKTRISLFKDAYTKAPVGEISLNDYFKGIKEGRWQDEVLKYRALSEGDKKKRAKEKIQAVTVSGSFSYDADANLIEHSGLIAIDIDAKDQTRPIPDIIKDIKEMPELYALHYSVSGYSLVAYFKISKSKHKEAFEAIEKYLANNYEVVVDSSGRNVSRLRFVSYDEELYLNQGAETWKQYIKKEEKIQELSRFVYSNNDIDFIIRQISERRACICPDYYSWVRVGFALAHEYGESGRKYFIAISSTWNGEEKRSADKQYDLCLKRDAQRNGGVTIKTLFWLAKEAGLQIQTERTAKIKMIGKMHRKQEGKNGFPFDAKPGIKQVLEEIENISGSDVDQILEQVWKLPKEDLYSDENESILIEVETFLKTNYKFRLNEISRKVEIDGEEINDKVFNSIYLKCKRTVSDKVAKEIVYDMIHSDFTPAYNPIMEWFEKNKHIKTTGNIKKLAECIESNLTRDDPEFIAYFVEKWLLSIIASAHGIYSILCLVFTGQEHGTGKTNFFRGLLPEELRWLFAQNKLDGKEADVAKLMCVKWLILDDEFGGKSKADEKKFKELISTDVFSVRMPYGRYHEDLKRLAVLCGTSNEEKIINDLTGNRRIIPIQVNNIDEKKFNEIDKTELLIELYHKFRKDSKGWFLTKDDIKRLNEICYDAIQVAPEMELPIKYFEKSSRHEVGSRFVSSSEIRSVIEQKSGIRLSQQKLSVSLKNLGFGADRSRVDGTQIRGFWVKIRNEGVNNQEESYIKPDEEPLPF